MRFYGGIRDSDIYGKDPIPTPRLDSLTENMRRLKAEEGLTLIEALNTQSTEKDKRVISWEKERKRLIGIINPITPTEKMEAELAAWKSLYFKMTGKRMSKETEKAFRGGM